MEKRLGIRKIGARIGAKVVTDNFNNHCYQRYYDNIILLFTYVEIYIYAIDNNMQLFKHLILGKGPPRRNRG